MNDGLLRVLIDETVAAATRQTPVPKIMPATVTEASDPLAVLVRIDGDVDSVPAQTVVGPVFDGARVMVTFNPPSGLLITGWIPDPLMAWQTPVFLNGWVDFDPVNYQVARYRLETEGRVRLQGLIRAGAVGSAAFAVPTRLAPPAASQLLFEMEAGGAPGRLDIAPSGLVTPVMGSNAYFSLNCTWVVAGS